MQVAQLQGFHRRAVVALCFSPGDGTYLASVGQDNDHSVAIYDWAKEELLATYKGDPNPVLCIAWSHFDHTIVTTGKRTRTLPPSSLAIDTMYAPCTSTISGLNECAEWYTSRLLTGVKHAKFVMEPFSATKPIVKGSRFRPKKGVLGKKGKVQNFYSAAFVSQGSTVVGTRSGELYVFEKTTLADTVAAHKVLGPVHSMCVSPLELSRASQGMRGSPRKVWPVPPPALPAPARGVELSAEGVEWNGVGGYDEQGKVCALHAVGNMVISGGDDGVVRTWKASDLSPLTTSTIPVGPSKEPSCVRSVFADSSVSILVGTKSNEIWEITDKPRILHQVRYRTVGPVAGARQGLGGRSIGQPMDNRRGATTPPRTLSRV